ncbi:hypothetical protein SMC26_22260 [Actinomadura fulvescens]|uniref:Uncharacterized protein n=1 Tax=Actinomadura fulvescens TaxID=46160 RepID=A0ABN3PKH6_9ACTN
MPVAIVDPLPAFRVGLATELTKVGFTVEDPEDLEAWLRDKGRRSLIFTAGEGDGHLRLLRRENPDLVIVALVTRLDPTAFGTYIKLGCHGVVDRAAVPRAILAALELAVFSHCAVPHEIAQKIVAHIPDSRVSGLPIEHIEWLRILAAGSTVAELARRVGYSTREMHRLLAKMYCELGVKGRTEALILASRHGLLLET